MIPSSRATPSTMHPVPSSAQEASAQGPVISLLTRLPSAESGGEFPPPWDDRHGLDSCHLAWRQPHAGCPGIPGKKCPVPRRMCASCWATGAPPCIQPSLGWPSRSVVTWTSPRTKRYLNCLPPGTAKRLAYSITITSKQTWGRRPILDPETHRRRHPPPGTQKRHATDSAGVWRGFHILQGPQLLHRRVPGRGRLLGS